MTARPSQIEDHHYRVLVAVIVLPYERFPETELLVKLPRYVVRYPDLEEYLVDHLALHYLEHHRKEPCRQAPAPVFGVYRDVQDMGLAVDYPEDDVGPDLFHFVYFDLEDIRGRDRVSEFALEHRPGPGLREGDGLDGHDLVEVFGVHRLDQVAGEDIVPGTQGGLPAYFSLVAKSMCQKSSFLSMYFCRTLRPDRLMNSLRHKSDLQPIFLHTGFMSFSTISTTLLLDLKWLTMTTWPPFLQTLLTSDMSLYGSGTTVTTWEIKTLSKLSSLKLMRMASMLMTFMWLRRWLLILSFALRSIAVERSMPTTLQLCGNSESDSPVPTPTSSTRSPGLMSM